MRIYVLPYKVGSRSARSLTERLREEGQNANGVRHRAKRIKLRGSRYRPRSTHVVVNWGNCSTQAHDLCLQHPGDVLNQPYRCSVAVSKLGSLEVLSSSGVPVPEFTTSAEEARSWGQLVVARTMLRASSGRGIILCDSEDVPQAPLYVKYIKKTQEYRVHVFNNEVIDVQRKMRSRDVPDDEVNWQIRNHSNGFVFGRGDVNPDDRLSGIAVESVRALGLDFGAVDIIYNDRRSQYYVLEVNTAPGLEGTTLDKYSTAIAEYTQRVFR